jgi:hypothetical protein
MVKIGITGTRSGIDTTQFLNVKKILSSYPEGSELHHGDCVGVDIQVAAIAKDFGFKIICHPPIKEELRGYFESDEYRPPLSYFARNRNIVNETDILLVLPYQTSHQNHGGTWYTHDYAKKVNKQTIVLYPAR